jgi:RimJ/RimL family protein N-acetyltransferase
VVPGSNGEDGGVDAPPERIALPTVGVVLRRHRADDVDAMHAAIETSRDHLRPFIPFADQSRQETGAFVERAIASWDDRTDFRYLAIDDADGDVLGGCDIHRRIGPDAAEVGYWLRAGATGRGIVSAAAAALTQTAFAIDGVERVEIHCDVANTRSAEIARRLGYELDRIDPVPITAPGEQGLLMIWVLHRPWTARQGRRRRRRRRRRPDQGTVPSAVSSGGFVEISSVGTVPGDVTIVSPGSVAPTVPPVTVGPLSGVDVGTSLPSSPQAANESVAPATTATASDSERTETVRGITHPLCPRLP